MLQQVTDLTAVTGLGGIETNAIDAEALPTILLPGWRPFNEEIRSKSIHGYPRRASILQMLIQVLERCLHLASGISLQGGQCC